MENSWTLGPREFIFKYLKYLPLIILCGVIGFAMAYIKLRYIVPIYRVQASLLIEDERDNGLQKDQRFDQLFMTQSSSNLSNESAILRSSPLLERVAKDLGLQVAYYNTGNLRSTLTYPYSPIELQIMQVADSSRAFGFVITLVNDMQFRINENKTLYAFGQSFNWVGNICTIVRNKSIDVAGYSSPKFLIGWQPSRQAAISLINDLRVAQTNEQTTILTLTFDNENPVLGINILNTLMKVYDSLIIEDKTRIAINTERFIDTRLASLRTELTGVEDKQKANIEQNETFNIEDQSRKYFDDISDADKKLIDLDVRLRVVDLLSEYIENKANVHQLVPTSLGIEEPALLQFVNQYNQLQLEREKNLRTTSANNALIIGMDNSLEKLRSSIREALQNVKNGYHIAYSRLQQEEDVMKAKMKTLPGKSMEFLNVGRQQKILEELYSFLLQKKIESSISSASTISNSKVLEPALANPNPISPDRGKTFSLYVLISLLIPVAFVFILEVLKDKVGSRMEVEKRTTAPILGEVGHSEEAILPLVVTQNSRSMIAEQFRIIRTNLKYVTGRKENAVILITSSFSGEGKSFISTNMGAVLALSGKKTVIMEFDIRKPKIVSGLELKRKMGITNYIIGKASFNELLVKVDGIDNLYVIPCGSHSSQPRRDPAGLTSRRTDG